MSTDISKTTQKENIEHTQFVGTVREGDDLTQLKQKLRDYFAKIPDVVPPNKRFEFEIYIRIHEDLGE